MTLRLGGRHSEPKVPAEASEERSNLQRIRHCEARSNLRLQGDCFAKQQGSQ